MEMGRFRFLKCPIVLSVKGLNVNSEWQILLKRSLHSGGAEHPRRWR